MGPMVGELEALTDRVSYLIEGRRVRMADLIQANLLEPGTELEFHRPRVAERHRATVLDDGTLQLEDSRAYESPSRAAGAAAGGSFDGWYAWRVVETGELLANLRQELIGEASQADELPTAIGNNSMALSRRDFLRRARDAATAGRPIETTVRELIAHWGAKTRGQVITERIENDLDNHGLITEPHFRKVGLDSLISVRAHAQIEDTIENAESPEPLQVEFEGIVQPGATPDKSEPPDEVGLTLGNIPSAETEVAAVNPAASYEEAITLMLLNDYSQLAVMSNAPRGLKGAITWQSIARENMPTQSRECRKPSFRRKSFHTTQS